MIAAFSPQSAAQRMTLPPERFYWALLDAGVLPTRKRSDAQVLGCLFEATLPMPIETLHAVYHRMDAKGAKILACAIARDDLHAYVECNTHALALCPESFPDFLRGTVDREPSSLNLLSGEFEARPMRQAKRRFSWHMAALFMGLAMIVMLGLERRIVNLREQADQARSAQAQIIQQTIGNGDFSAGTQPPELRFLVELRSLRQTRQHPTGASAGALVDVTPSLAGLLQRWPADLHALTDSISITSTSITLRGLVPSSADAQALADALTALEGWRLQQPQINAAPPQGVTATLQWKREAAP